MRKVRKSKQRSKALSLSKLHWLRNSIDVKEYREAKLKSQGGVCAITGVPLEVGCLDHVHTNGVGEDGTVRGVLLSEANTLEGRYLKLFKKMKMGVKYNLTFPEFLIDMGNYLREGASSELLHFKYMDERRKAVSRLTKPAVIALLREEFKLEADSALLKVDIVQVYMQEWVDKLEGR